MAQLIASKPLRYGGKRITAGGQFNATDRDARTLIATGRATVRPFARLQDQLEKTTARIVSARIIAKALVDGSDKDPMSITGADNFAGMLREQLARCRAGIEQARGEMVKVLERGQEVRVLADEIVAQAQKEVAELEGELRQLSNFPPMDGGST